MANKGERGGMEEIARGRSGHGDIPLNTDTWRKWNSCGRPTSSEEDVAAAYLRMALQAVPNAQVIVSSPPYTVAVMQHPTPSVTNTLVNGVTVVSSQSSLTPKSYQLGN
ncbi:hypothetical protein AX14_012925 [Amanita brunnescens Koide BX004]|nr:hypothetical protein AX14_012925 [Amanita brunnescens Koide BX004]